MTNINLTSYHIKVKQIAYKWYQKVGIYSQSVTLEDFIQEGMVGLYESKRLFNKDKGNNFWAFAKQRVEGTIINSFQKIQLVKFPQEIRDKIKKYNKTYNELMNILDREPDNIEVAEKMNISESEVVELSQMIISFKKLDDLDISDDNSNNDFMRQKLFEDIEECLNNFTNEEKLIYIARVKNEVPLKHLAKSFNFSYQKIWRIEQELRILVNECLNKKEWSFKDAVKTIKKM